MLLLALRNIFRHKGRTILTLAAIVLGVAGLVISGGFVEDIFVQLREATIHSRLGHIQVHRRGFLEVGRREPSAFLIEEPETLASRLRSLPRVGDVLARMQFSGLLNTGVADQPVIGEGVQPQKEARLGTYTTIVDGRQLDESDSYGIVLGEGVAKASELAPGDYVTLLTNTTDGALNSLEFEVVGVFRTFSKDFDDRAVRIPLSAAQELIVSPGAHVLVLVLDETDSTHASIASVRELIEKDGYEARTWFELADFYRKTVALYERQFGVLQLIILIMIVLSVANSVNMAIFERTGEYGTLMAIGDRPRDVFGLIMAENALLGFGGAAIGISLGVAIAVIASTVGIPMPPPPNSNAGYVAQIQLQPATLVVGFLVGAMATICAALLPARRASRLPIIDALRENV